jgi:hypothetical protein
MVGLRETGRSIKIYGVGIADLEQPSSLVDLGSGSDGVVVRAPIPLRRTKHGHVHINGADLLVSWEKNSGPLVSLNKLYPLGGEEWGARQRRKTYQNEYRKEKRRKLRASIAESGQISLWKQKGAA